MTDKPKYGEGMKYVTLKQASKLIERDTGVDFSEYQIARQHFTSGLRLFVDGLFLAENGIYGSFPFIQASPTSFGITDEVIIERGLNREWQMPHEYLEIFALSIDRNNYNNGAVHARSYVSITHAVRFLFQVIWGFIGILNPDLKAKGYFTVDDIDFRVKEDPSKYNDTLLSYKEYLKTDDTQKIVKGIQELATFDSMHMTGLDLINECFNLDLVLERFSMGFVDDDGNADELFAIPFAEIFVLVSSLGGLGVKEPTLPNVTLPARRRRELEKSGLMNVSRETRIAVEKLEPFFRSSGNKKDNRLGKNQREIIEKLERIATLGVITFGDILDIEWKGGLDDNVCRTLKDSFIPQVKENIAILLPD